MTLDNRDIAELKEMRRVLGLRPDAPLGYITSAIHHLIFKPGTRVCTLKPLHENNYKAGANRQWGVKGKILTHHDSHGLCFEVKHEDHSIGTYDPDEIEVIS